MPVILTTLSAARTDVRVARELRAGRRDGRGRPGEDVQRVDSLERLQEALRRELLVDAGQDLGLLHGAPKV